MATTSTNIYDRELCNNSVVVGVLDKSLALDTMHSREIKENEKFTENLF